MWACLIVTAFVIAPIAVVTQGGSAAKLLLSRAPFEYVLENSAARIFQPDIGGTPRGVPWFGVWNGSLWTLVWELLCYIAVAGLGVVGLLRRRWLIPALLALALYFSAKLTPYRVLGEAPPETWQHIDAATVKLVTDGIAARFAVMFLAGALLYRFRGVIPARWSLVAVSLVIVLAASLLPNYRVVAAIPLAYAIIVSGALIHNKRLRLRTDLSYGVYIYAFPMQQLLVICGLAILNPIAFAIIAAIATLPLAIASRAELVSGREARGFFETSPQAEKHRSDRGASARANQNVNILRPSMGVGGYFLTKDPWFVNHLGQSVGQRANEDAAGLVDGLRARGWHDTICHFESCAGWMLLNIPGGLRHTAAAAGFDQVVVDEPQQAKWKLCGPFDALPVVKRAVRAILHE